MTTEGKCRASTWSKDELGGVAGSDDLHMMGTSSNFGNMFSMAGAALFLSFLPMSPTQILFNDILYDISEAPIPLDEVDPEDLRKPHVLDMNFIRDFMLGIGPISSAFDFLTFYILLTVLKANETLFQTYLVIVEVAKQGFYRWYGVSDKARK